MSKDLEKEFGDGFGDRFGEGFGEGFGDGFGEGIRDGFGEGILFINFHCVMRYFYNERKFWWNILRLGDSRILRFWYCVCIMSEKFNGCLREMWAI